MRHAELNDLIWRLLSVMEVLRPYHTPPASCVKKEQMNNRNKSQTTIELSKLYPRGYGS
jgi:hypothetical protein